MGDSVYKYFLKEFMGVQSLFVTSKLLYRKIDAWNMKTDGHVSIIISVLFIFLSNKYFLIL